MKAWPIYVAGASAEIERAERAIALVRGCDRLRLTFDWPAAMRASKPESELDAAERIEVVRQCLDGVDTACALWLLVPNGASVGAWVELGHALNCGVRIVSSGGRDTIWTAPLSHYATDADAWDAIQRWAGGA